MDCGLYYNPFEAMNAVGYVEDDSDDCVASFFVQCELQEPEEESQEICQKGICNGDAEVIDGCVTCWSKFRTKTSDDTHDLVHDLDIEFPKVLLTKLTDKIMLKHTGRHYCTICLKEFTMRHHLVSHYDVHREHRRFPCELCGKRFKRRVNLRNHQTVHFPIEKYGCDICDERFVHKNAYILHLGTHNAEGMSRIQEIVAEGTDGSDVRRFKCEVCESSFKLKHHLVNHMSKHITEKNFQCPMCERRYKTQREQARHTKTHVEGRLHCCPVCPKSFTQSYYLHSHMLTHDAFRPFQCSKCPRAFKVNYNLQRHLQTTHATPVAAQQPPAPMRPPQILPASAKRNIYLVPLTMDKVAIHPSFFHPMYRSAFELNVEADSEILGM